jgi:hypothetical protein
LSIEKEDETEIPMDVDISNVSSFYTVETMNDDTTTLSQSNEIHQSKDISLTEASCQTLPTPMMSVENFVHDSEGIMFYTGLANYTDFLFVMYCLGEAAYHLRYLYNQVQNVSIENQLFLTDQVKTEQNQL